MPKRVAEVGEGHKDASGTGVYCIIRDLLVEGRDARFVGKKGRYVINWSRAIECYHDYKSKRIPQYNRNDISRRSASNSLRGALLNHYEKEGAKEYENCRLINKKGEVVERQFQMPPRLFELLFGSDAQLSDGSSEYETSRVISESQVSDQTDSGIEITDNIGGNRLPLLCDAIEIISTFKEKKLIIQEIIPKESSIRGGDMFVLILKEDLLSNTDEGYYAKFGFSAPVVLTKENQVSLKGMIPAYYSPGVVTVEVVSSTGHLGQTQFKYIDAVDEILKKLEHDKELHNRFFHLMAQELRSALRKPEKQQPSPAISGFLTPGIPDSPLSLEDDRKRSFVSSGYKADNEASDDGELPTSKEDMKKRAYEGSDYEADDEGSDDEEVPCTKVAGWNPISQVFSLIDIIGRMGHRGDIEQPCGPPAGESVDGRFCNITDTQKPVFQVNHYIFVERFPNSHDLNNLTPYSFNAQESGARISEVEPSAIPSKSSDEVAGTACDNNGTVQSNSDSPETVNNPENMDIVDNQLNNVDFDQNSVADKTWYSDKRSGDEDDDSPGNPL